MESIQSPLAPHSKRNNTKFGANSENDLREMLTELKNQLNHSQHKDTPAVLRKLFLELPMILEKSFGLDSSRSTPSIFMDGIYDSRILTLFSPIGPLLHHIEILEKEGKRYELPIQSLPMFIRNKLERDPKHLLPSMIKSMLTPSQNYSLSARPVAFYFTLFFLKVLSAKDNESIDNSSSLYYKLVNQYLNFYIPKSKDIPFSNHQLNTSDSSTTTSFRSRINSNTASALSTYAASGLQCGAAAVRGIQPASLERYDHRSGSSSDAFHSLDAHRTETVLSIMMEIFLGQYNASDFSVERATRTHRAYVAILVRWLQQSLSFHQQITKHLSQKLKSSQQDVEHHRRVIIETIYFQYLRGFYRFFVINLIPQTVGYLKVLTAFETILSPWKYTHPQGSDLAIDTGVEYVQHHVLFYTLLIRQIIQHLQGTFVAFGNFRQSSESESILQRTANVLSTLLHPIGEMRVVDIVQQEETLFFTRSGRSSNSCRLHDQLHRFDPVKLREYVPLFTSSEDVLPGYARANAASQTDIIIASYRCIRNHIAEARKLSKSTEHMSALKYVAAIFDLQPDNSSKLKKYLGLLSQIERNLRTLFPHIVSKVEISSPQISFSADGQYTQTSLQMPKHVARQKARSHYLQAVPSLRMQPTRTFEFGFMIPALNFLSTWLNDRAFFGFSVVGITCKWALFQFLAGYVTHKLDPRPWFKNKTYERITAELSEHLQDEGRFIVCCPSENDQPACFTIFVVRDNSVHKDVICCALSGGLTLDGRINFADLSELISFYKELGYMLENHTIESFFVNLFPNCKTPYYVDSTGREHKLRDFSFENIPYGQYKM
eukprot:gene7017-408_t